MTGILILDAIIIAGAVTAALMGLFKAFKAIAGLVRRVTHFLDDYLGTEERPGVPARAGLSERLASIEHELHPNSGTSMRDSIDRIESRLDGIEEVAVRAYENSEATRADLTLAKEERQELLRAISIDRHHVEELLGVDLGEPAWHAQAVNDKE